MTELRSLPQWLGYRRLERASFAQIRNLRGENESWGTIIAGAQRTLLEYQELSEAETRLLLIDPEAPLPLLAAARSLDAASRRQSGIDDESRRSLALEGAVAYSMAGNHVSAGALLGASQDQKDWVTRTYPEVASLACPSLIRHVIAQDPESYPEAWTLIESVLAFLDSPYSLERAWNTLIENWRKCVLRALEDGDAFRGYLLRSCRIVTYQLKHLAIASVLSGHSAQLIPGHLQTLMGSGRHLLLPSQLQAFSQGILDSTQNAVLCMPTSSGKTLLGELCLSQSLGAHAGLAIYVAPYRALAGQVFRSLREHLPNEFARVEQAIGGYDAGDRLKVMERPTILVCTPERLDSLLRSQPELLDSLRCVVLDEAHLVEQLGRGSRLECMIARLLLRRSQSPQLRIVLISAVLTDAASLSTWLGEGTRLIVSDWRPTTRRLARWEQGGQLRYYYADDPLEERDVRRGRPVAERVLVQPVKLPDVTSHFGEIKQNAAGLARNIGYLTHTIWTEYESPVLAICSTRANTRLVAAGACGELPPRPLGPKSEEVVRVIGRKHKHLRSLARMITFGVAYHNAGLPHEVRDLIEAACNERELLLVAATTTLAEGVDLPFRFCILVDWFTWTDDGIKPQSPLLFRNISGRCGRAGVHTEGDTIVYENPLVAGAYQWPGARLQAIDDILFPGSITLESSFQSAQKDAKPAQREEIYALVESQLAAAIPENRGVENLADEFYKRTLSSVQGNGFLHIVRSIENDLISDPVRPVAVRNSPLALTTYGNAVVQTGLAASSCKHLMTSLERALPAREMVGALVLLLDAAHGMPEFVVGTLGKIAKKNNKFPVKRADYTLVLQGWLSGLPETQMFASLPSIKKSKRKGPRIAEWLTGLDAPSTWDEAFDKMGDFNSAVTMGVLPWLCRAVERLQGFLPTWVQALPWGTWAKWLESGVDSHWAATFLSQCRDAGRPACAIVGRATVATVGHDDPDLNLLTKSSENLRSIVAATRSVLDPVAMHVDPEEFNELFAWLIGSDWKQRFGAA